MEEHDTPTPQPEPAPAIQASEEESRDESDLTPPEPHAAAGPETAPEPQAQAKPEPAEPQPEAQEVKVARAQDTAEERKAEPVAEEKPEEKKDFAEILAQFEHGQGAERRENPAAGAKVKGKVLSIGEESVFIDLGTKSEGMIEAAQLRDAEGRLTVKVGDTVEATVTAVDPESGVLVLKKRTGGRHHGPQEVATELRQAHQYGMPVEGLVTGINKGGAEVQVYAMRGFCPLSQLDLRYVDNPQRFIGQKLKFRVSRIEEGSRNRRPDIVLSRRALLEEEAQAKAAELRARLRVGAVLTGKVTSLTTYGAFIDLGGLEGLLHVSEIGFSRLADPREALAVGQEIEVQVIKIEKGKDEKRPERISLSRRALERDPWRDAQERFPEGAIITGRVVRLESFGAFVELAPGLEGLVHVSEIGAGRRVNHARDAVQLGQDVRVKVLGVDTVKRRISLSIGAAAAAAAPENDPVAEEPPARETREAREAREPATASQGSSFGSLGDFFKDSSLKNSSNRRK